MADKKTNATERTEHIEWCKKRALEYVDNNDLPNAIASMLSDLNKSDETRGHVGIDLLPTVDSTNAISVRNWIEGFA